MLNHNNARLLVILTRIKFADYQPKDDDAKIHFTLLIHSLYDQRIKAEKDDVEELNEERNTIINVIEDYFQSEERLAKQTVLYKWAINCLYHYLLDTKSKEIK